MKDGSKINKVYLIGEIIEISDYGFYYNSKKHNSRIIIKIKTFEGICQSSEIIEVNAYDNLADKIYRYCKNGDKISIEGRIGKHMIIEAQDLSFISTKYDTLI